MILYYHVAITYGSYRMVKRGMCPIRKGFGIVINCAFLDRRHCFSEFRTLFDVLLGAIMLFLLCSSLETYGRIVLIWSEETTNESESQSLTR